MRKYKFRAWDNRFGKMWDWQHIKTGYMQGYFDNYYDVRMMQYTGLKDKNGVEIYEGDIVECEGVVYPVYQSPSGEWMIDDMSLYAMLKNNWYPVENVGNIYENPELLEER